MNKLQGEILTLPKMVGSVGAKTVFVGGGDGGENGATFYPAVSDDGVISWTNNKGLSNPTPVNIKGPAGPAGPQGEKGAAGPQGPQGNPGAKGDKGDTGPKGETGETGPAGADGQPGKDGADGKDGSPGADGFSPTVSVTDITGGHRVTITDKDGDKTFDVMDGEGGTGGSAEGGGVCNCSEWEIINEVTTTEEVTGVTISTDLNGNAFDLIEGTAFIMAPADLPNATWYLYSSPGTENYTMFATTSIRHMVFEYSKLGLVIRIAARSHNAGSSYGSSQSGQAIFNRFRFLNWDGAKIPIGTKIRLIGRREKA